MLGMPFRMAPMWYIKVMLESLMSGKIRNMHLTEVPDIDIILSNINFVAS